MRYKVEALEGTGMVEVYDGKKPVAGPFTPGEAEAWIDMQEHPGEPAEEEATEEPEPFEPVGIL